ncbi:MAG: hypothetical protein QMD17_11615 [Rhodocyclaceae bacterium]|nr:hypothetical protein [Rhodocyclaceae bacterium]
MKQPLVLSVTITALLLPAGIILAADPPQVQAKSQTQQQGQIYGSQLMTQQKCNEYRAKMRATTMAEERERIRMEHHEAMKARARERNMTLPDEPPAGGGSMGPGGAGGMGPGGGRGR